MGDTASGYLRGGGSRPEEIGRSSLGQRPGDGGREDGADVAIDAKSDERRSIVVGGTAVDDGVGSTVAGCFHRYVGRRGHRECRAESDRDVGPSRGIERSRNVDGSQLLAERDRRRLEKTPAVAKGRFAGLLERSEVLTRFGPGATGLANRRLILCYTWPYTDTSSPDCQGPSSEHHPSPSGER